VRGAYTYEKPRRGTEIDVLWARSALELGGYANGAVLGLVFTLVPDAYDLQELAWSAPLQTVRAVLAGALYWGWLPLLLGQTPSIPQMLCVIGAFVLVMLGHVFTSVRSIG
jgi:hypothetical protein